MCFSILICPRAEGDISTDTAVTICDIIPEVSKLGWRARNFASREIFDDGKIIWGLMMAKNVIGLWNTSNYETNYERYPHFA